MQKVTSKKNSHFLGYRNLIAWQVADELAKAIYKITLSFPKHELYGLTSQLRRAALSVPLNITEGFARNNKNEFRQFLRIALGSLAEVEYLLEFALFQRYLTQKEFDQISILRKRCGQILWGLYKSQT